MSDMAYFLFTNIDVTLLLIFNLFNHQVKELIVSTANETQVNN